MEEGSRSCLLIIFIFSRRKGAMSKVKSEDGDGDIVGGV